MSPVTPDSSGPISRKHMAQGGGERKGHKHACMERWKQERTEGGGGGGVHEIERGGGGRVGAGEQRGK